MKSLLIKPIFDLSIKSAYWSCLRLLSYDQDAKKKKAKKPKFEI